MKLVKLTGILVLALSCTVCSSDNKTRTAVDSAATVAESRAESAVEPAVEEAVDASAEAATEAAPQTTDTATAAVGDAKSKVDSDLPTYTKVGGIAGNLSSVGSDTLANLMTLWAEGFKRVYPSVNIQIQAAGSSTAPPGLTEGTSNLGPMSRQMKDNELEAFEKRFGYKPTAVPVAIDALAVYVHKDNPLKGLSIPQVDAIFSVTRRCGADADITAWADLGLDGSWASRSIQLFGRNSVSGTYGYFKKRGLCKGDFKDSVNEQPGSASVVQSVSTSINGLGYSGIGYRTSGIRLVPLAKKEGGEFIAATSENAVNGSYPLARYLYVYVNKKPNQSLAPLELEFLNLVLSKAGQEVVVKDGYIPLPAAAAAKARKLIAGG